MNLAAGLSLTRRIALLHLVLATTGLAALGVDGEDYSEEYIGVVGFPALYGGPLLWRLDRDPVLKMISFIALWIANSYFWGAVVAKGINAVDGRRQP